MAKQKITVQPLAYTVEEAADAVRLGKDKMYELVAAGRVPSVLIDRCRRISVRRLEEWLETLTEQQMCELWGEDWRGKLAA